MSKYTTMEDKLGLDKFILFHETHLKIKEGFKTGNKAKDLVDNFLFICPAKVYTLNDKQEVVVSFENCLECGTCRVAAPDAVDWEHPQGGHGVHYRFG
jgi:ferredoxin like protein